MKEIRKTAAEKEVLYDLLSCAFFQQMLFRIFIEAFEMDINMSQKGPSDGVY